jgi:hypothetical protein
MVDPSGEAEILVVAGLADVVRTTAQRARGSPLDQYLPWYIVRLSGALSEKFTESLNSCAGVARVESEGLATRNTKRLEKVRCRIFVFYVAIKCWQGNSRCRGVWKCRSPSEVDS